MLPQKHVAFLALCEIYSREMAMAGRRAEQNCSGMAGVEGQGEDQSSECEAYPSCAVEGAEVIVTLCRCRCSSADVIASSYIFVSLKQLCPECTLIQSDAAFEVHLKSSTCLPTY